MLHGSPPFCMCFEGTPHRGVMMPGWRAASSHLWLMGWREVPNMWCAACGKRTAEAKCQWCGAVPGTAVAGKGGERPADASKTVATVPALSPRFAQRIIFALVGTLLLLPAVALWLVWGRGFLVALGAVLVALVVVLCLTGWATSRWPGLEAAIAVTDPTAIPASERGLSGGEASTGPAALIIFDRQYPYGDEGRVIHDLLRRMGLSVPRGRIRTIVRLGIRSLFLGRLPSICREAFAPMLGAAYDEASLQVTPFEMADGTPGFVVYHP